MSHARAFGLPCIVAMLAAAIMLTVQNRAWAQDYSACVQQKLANFQTAPEPFSAEGEVVCPEAQGSSMAPSPRRFDTTSLFAYEVPAGYEIVPGSVAVDVLASDTGRNDPPEIHGNRIIVPLMCEGKDLGRGQSFHRIRLTGLMRVPLSPETVSEAETDCRRCGGRPSC
jgi:hypothetical protein